MERGPHLTTCRYTPDQRRQKNSMHEAHCLETPGAHRGEAKQVCAARGKKQKLGSRGESSGINAFSSRLDKFFFLIEQENSQTAESIHENRGINKNVEIDIVEITEGLRHVFYRETLY